MTPSADSYAQIRRLDAIERIKNKPKVPIEEAIALPQNSTNLIKNLNAPCRNCQIPVYRKGNKCCSKECYKAMRKTDQKESQLLAAQCLICAAPVKRFGHKFCSVSCRGQSLKGKPTERRKPNHFTNRKCLNCDAYLRASLKTFCSRTCSGKYRVQKIAQNPKAILISAQKRCKPDSAYPTKVCENLDCGKSFVGKGHRKRSRFCSYRCARTLFRATVL